MIQTVWMLQDVLHVTLISKGLGQHTSRQASACIVCFNFGGTTCCVQASLHKGSSAGGCH